MTWIACMSIWTVSGAWRSCCCAGCTLVPPCWLPLVAGFHFELTLLVDYLSVVPCCTCCAAFLPPLLLRLFCCQIEALTVSKGELKTQVRTLLASQTDLLTRVATLTTKWQQAVAEIAALHRQNLALAASQCL